MRRPAAEASGWLVATMPFMALTTERVPPRRALGRSPTAFCESAGSTCDAVITIASMRAILREECIMRGIVSYGYRRQTAPGGQGQALPLQYFSTMQHFATTL